MSTFCANCDTEAYTTITIYEGVKATGAYPLCVTCFEAFEWGHTVAIDGDNYAVDEEVAS